MKLVWRFALLVVILSVGELYLLMWVAARTSILLTLLLCILTGLAGGAMVRSQGLSTWRAIQNELARGRAPAIDIVSGLILIVIGTFLLTPGFITDTLAFILLLPGLRRWAAGRLVRYFQKRVGTAGRRFHGFRGPRTSNRESGENIVIEVEAEEVETGPQKDQSAERDN